jgi:pyruvate kinase
VRVHLVGNILARGLRGFGGRFTGRVVKADSLEEATHALRNKGGEILITHTLDSSFVPIIRIAGGIIVEGASELSREHLTMINPNIVYVSQVANAMKLLEEHLSVTIDGAEKTIYEGTSG